MGFFEVLLVIFVVLKVTNTVDWSWWLVLLPAFPAAIVWFIVVFTAVRTGLRNNRY